MKDAPFTPDEATRRQIGAADPAGSVWLGANAGSGKTRVLTDRVAWLLFDGTPPDRILCLTYTKAAAGEMQNRLFKTLGEWAMASDDALRAALLKFGIRRGTIDTPDLRRARTLFAQAIETPGGLKIQTIHAFCAGLLRRFPLEAGVSAGFREMEERAGAQMRRDVLDRLAVDAPDALAGVAVQGGDPDAFAAEVMGRAEALAAPAPDDALRALLGLDRPADEVPTAADLRLLADALPALRSCGKTDSKRLADAAALLPGCPTPTEARAVLVPAMLTKGAPRKRLLNAGAAGDLGEDGVEAITDLAARLATRMERERAEANLLRQRALHGFAPAFVDRVATEKARRGWLDFDDQIRLARRLLCDDRGVAQWVLYKLDGGIDHVLVDEAQDTSPVQWDLIEALVREFGAGEGARGALARTVFVVGDRKQSIFSFQGADPKAFDAMRTRIGDLLAGGPAPLEDHHLLHSFRSAPAILEVVDRVAAAAAGVGPPPEHRAFFGDLPGRVDLWPAIPDGDAAEEEWWRPVDRRAEDSGTNKLAKAIADRVARMLRDGEPVVEHGVRRPIEPRDILILTRSRKDLFHAIIAALKAHPDRPPLAGTDRVRLRDEIAVQDLVALLRVAATPEDDLSLAEVLRSPLADVDEDALFRLAHGRGPRPLWAVLRESEADPRARDMVADLMARADFLRPYEMLQRILIHHDGMRRLLGRLGEEAREGIDLLLQQALAFEALEVPNLTGFLEWLDAAEPEVKRQSGAGAIRIMTVHGAKGLEAPVVILPQCGAGWNAHQPALARAAREDGSGDEGPVLWMPPTAEMSPALETLNEARKRRRDDERDRLLYVALTRASQWLIVAVAENPPASPRQTPTWHDRVAEALATAAPCPPGEGPEGTLRHETGDWTRLPPARAAAAAPALPEGCAAWLDVPAPPATPAAAPLAPSDLGGAKAVAGDDADDFERDVAMAHGTRVHLLLEHLPGVPPPGRAAAARTLLEREGWFDPDENDDALAEAAACLHAPGLAWVFAPDTLAEAPFVLPRDGDRPEVSGTMDRVVVRDDEVWVIDHKTNAVLPAAPEDVPEGLLRQLGAYAAALAAIYPGRRIRPAILWTGAARLMEVPAPLCAAAWARATARPDAERAPTHEPVAVDPPESGS